MFSIQSKQLAWFMCALRSSGYLLTSIISAINCENCRQEHSAGLSTLYYLLWPVRGALTSLIWSLPWLLTNCRWRQWSVLFDCLQSLLSLQYLETEINIAVCQLLSAWAHRFYKLSLTILQAWSQFENFNLVQSASHCTLRVLLYALSTTICT